MMQITPQALTTMIGPLREKGYITRWMDTAHARRLPLRLTAQGEKILARALNP